MAALSYVAEIVMFVFEIFIFKVRRSGLSVQLTQSFAKGLPSRPVFINSLAPFLFLYPQTTTLEKAGAGIAIPTVVGLFLFLGIFLEYEYDQVFHAHGSAKKQKQR